MSCYIITLTFLLPSRKNPLFAPIYLYPTPQSWEMWGYSPVRHRFHHGVAASWSMAQPPSWTMNSSGHGPEDHEGPAWFLWKPWPIYRWFTHGGLTICPIPYVKLPESISLKTVAEDTPQNIPLCKLYPHICNISRNKPCGSHLVNIYSHIVIYLLVLWVIQSHKWISQPCSSHSYVLLILWMEEIHNPLG